MKSLHIAQASIPEGVVNFAVGQPSPSLLPVEFMRQAAAHCLGQADPDILAYGARQGNGCFLQTLAAFLSEQYAVTVAPESLFVSAGVSSALELIVAVFTQPGDTIFVEEPTYFLAPTIFANHGLKVVSIPIDENGLITEVLDEKLTEYQPKFIYTVPTFHNPSTITMSQHRREHLLKLSQKYNFLIVADEVYQLLAYGDSPPLPFACQSVSENVLSLGSFSKMLAPGLRLGWIQTSPGLMDRINNYGYIQSGGGLSPFTSAVVQSVIELGLQERYLARLKMTYLRRITTMDQAIKYYLPDEVIYSKPDGGFFFWLCLPEDTDTVRLLSDAKTYQTGFLPGVRCSVRQAFSNYLRLSFAYFDEARIEQGIERLGQLIRHRS